MAISSTNGSKFYTTAAVALTATDTKAEYDALTWVEVGSVESIGPFGDTSQVVTFTGLSDARTRKRKGTRDAGDIALNCGHDAFDPGQILLVTQQATDFLYNYKVVEADGQDANDTDSTNYMKGLCASAQIDIGGTNKIVMRNFNILVDSEILEAPSTVVP